MNIIHNLETNPPMNAGATRRLVVDQRLLSLALVHAPEEIRQRVEAGAQEIASSLVVTTEDVEKAVREVAGDFNLKLSDGDVSFATGQLIRRHLAEEYIRERIDDHLGEQAEETLKELRYDLGEESLR